MRLASKQFVRTGATLAVGLIFLLCAATARFAWQYELATAWVKHTTSVMAKVRDTRVLLAAASGSSGSDLQSKLATITSELDQMAAMTRDNPEQQANVADLRIALASGKYSSGELRPADIVADSLILERMNREEYRLLSDRMNRQTEATRNGAFMACGLCFALLILGVATAAAARVAFNRREEAERALQKEKSELTRYSRDLALISSGSGLVQAAQKESEIYAAVAHTMRNMFPDSRGCVGIITPDRQFVEICAQWGDKAWVAFSPDECLALSSGNTVHRTRWHQQVCPAHPANVDGDDICIPIRTAAGMPGMLHLETPTAIGAKRVDVLTIFASHLGLGLANLKMREALKRDSIRDPLTGLFNRRYFDETLQHELARAIRHHMPLSLIILDLDRFKELNDTHGHLAGDDALRAFARILRSTFRAGDVLCRYGGEEFALLLSGADLESAWSKAETFRSAIQQAKITSNGDSVGTMTVSIGVAASTDFETPEELIRAADAALYQAKRSGRNTTWTCTCRSVPFPAIDCPTAQDPNRHLVDESFPPPSTRSANL